MNTHRILKFNWWLFFTIFNAYYCGILTMFFATTTHVQFKTIRDVIQAYPDWKLWFMHGGEIWVHDLAKQGDPDYITLWGRYLENPKETMFYSVEQGLKIIEEGQNVIYLDLNMILGHLKANPIKQNIRIIHTGTFDLSHLIFGKNSPLSPMFQQGTIYLRERGIERQMFYKWFGQLHEANNHEETTVTLGQMVLAFTMILVVFVVVTFILCGELLTKKLQIRPTNQNQSGCEE